MRACEGVSACVAEPRADVVERVTHSHSLLYVADAERLRTLDDMHRAFAEQGTTFGLELGRMMATKNRDRRLRHAAMQVYLRDVLVKDDTRSTSAPKRILSVNDSADLPPRKPDPAAHLRENAERARVRELGAEKCTTVAGVELSGQN